MRVRKTLSMCQPHAEQYVSTSYIMWRRCCMQLCALFLSTLRHNQYTQCPVLILHPQKIQILWRRKNTFCSCFPLLHILFDMLSLNECVSFRTSYPVRLAYLSRPNFINARCVDGDLYLLKQSCTCTQRWNLFLIFFATGGARYSKQFRHLKFDI